MRVGQRTTGRVIISGLGDFESRAVLSLNGLSESRALLGYVALVFFLKLADDLELGQSPGPELGVVLEGYFRKDDSGSISSQPRGWIVGCEDARAVLGGLCDRL